MDASTTALETDHEIPASRLMRERDMARTEAGIIRFERDYMRQRLRDQREENDRIAARLDAAIEREVAAYDRANAITHERDELARRLAATTEERDVARKRFAAAIEQRRLIMQWCGANLDAEQMASLLADPVGRDCVTCEGTGGYESTRLDEWVDCSDCRGIGRELR